MAQIDARVTTTTFQLNVTSFDRGGRIHIPPALVKAAFTENPRLVEYCRLTDAERTDANRAAPYVLEALVDLVRRAHQDPLSRNIYLNPNRADQVMVCVEEEGRPEQGDPRARWVVRPLVDAIRLLFDGVAEEIHRMIIVERERAQLPLAVQSAVAWVPSLYNDEPERFVREGRAPIAAHLSNARLTFDAAGAVALA